MKRLFDEREVEPKRMRVVMPAFDGDRIINFITEKAEEFLRTKGIALFYIFNSSYCSHSNVIFEISDSDDERWVSSMKYRHDSCVNVWLAYNFDIRDLFAESSMALDTQAKTLKNYLFLSIIQSEVTENDLPFWCIFESKLRFIEKLESKRTYSLLRNVKTTEILPITSLISYIAIAFQLPIALLEALYWNSISGNYQNNNIDEGRLIWNI